MNTRTVTRAARLSPMLLALVLAGCPEFPLAPTSDVTGTPGTGAAAVPTSSPGARPSSASLPSPTASASPAASPSVSPSPSTSPSPTATPTLPPPTPTPVPPGVVVIGTSPEASGSWSLGPAISRPRVSCIVAAMDTRLLVTDGDGQEVLEVYDQTGDAWGEQDLSSEFVRNTMTNQMGHYFSCGGVVAPNRLVMVSGYSGSGIIPATRLYTSQNTFQFGVQFGNGYLPTWRYASAGAVVGNKVYVAGGRLKDGTVSNAFEVLDADAGTWATAPSLPTAVAGAAAVTLGGKVYVIGGYDGSSRALSSVQVFDPTKNTWATDPSAGGITPMLVERHSAAATVLNGQIYVFGGVPLGASQAMAESEVFDPVAGAWHAIAPLPMALALHGAAALGGKIYVVGGENEFGEVQRGVEVYTP